MYINNNKKLVSKNYFFLKIKFKKIDFHKILFKRYLN
jgi:hypothetical protein